MTVVSISVRYVDAEGRLTLAGYQLLQELQGRLDAGGAVPAPAGGGVIDVEARNAISAIIAALGV
jgi:hypothetical protein